MRHRSKTVCSLVHCSIFFPENCNLISCKFNSENFEVFWCLCCLGNFHLIEGVLHELFLQDSLVDILDMFADVCESMRENELWSEESAIWERLSLNENLENHGMETSSPRTPPPLPVYKICLIIIKMNFIKLGFTKLSKSLTGLEFNFPQTLSIHLGMIYT